MEDNETSYLKYGTILLAVLIVSVSSCNAHIDYRIAQAIKGGADPIEARCAFSVAGSPSDCIILSAGKR